MSIFAGPRDLRLRSFALPRNFWRNNPVGRDTLVDEVRAVREAYAKRFNYDLKAIYLDLKEKEKTGGRKIVSLQPRRLQKVPHNS